MGFRPLTPPNSPCQSFSLRPLLRLSLLSNLSFRRSGSNYHAFSNELFHVGGTKRDFPAAQPYNIQRNFVVPALSVQSLDVPAQTIGDLLRGKKFFHYLSTAANAVRVAMRESRVQPVNELFGDFRKGLRRHKASFLCTPFCTVNPQFESFQSF